jgi:hypothetical protein
VAEQTTKRETIIVSEEAGNASRTMDYGHEDEKFLGEFRGRPGVMN